MLFRKNKINENIKEAAQEENTSSEFQSLSTVNQNRFVNKLKRKTRQEYDDAILNVKDKYARSTAYVKNHWFTFFKVLLVIMLITTIVYGCVILAMPFFANSPGEYYTPVNNFYIAKYVNNDLVFGLTGIGIGFICVFAITFVMLVFYIIWAFIKDKVICETNLATKIISIIAYCCIFIALILLIVPILITPNFSELGSKGQTATNLIVIANNTNLAQNVRIDAIKSLYNLFGYSLNTNGDIFQTFSNDLYNGKFAVNQVFNNYSFIQTARFFTQSSLAPAGIAFISLIVIFFTFGLIILPFTIFIIKMVHEYNVNQEVVSDWNSFKLFLLGMFNKTKSISTIFKEKAEKHKSKETFRKYRKEHKDKTIDQNEQFGSDKINNTISNVITKEEIESHEPNKAFLNNQGQWMYHDGKGKYFVVKNDEWVPYDINTVIHIAHVNINNKNDGEMSKKTVKESKLFKKNKNKNNENNNNGNKLKSNNALVDLPDEELDKIISELDI